MTKACVTILTNEHFTDHGFHTVEQRIKRGIGDAIFGEANHFVVDLQQRESLDSSESKAVFEDRMKYVGALLNKEAALAYAILSCQIPPKWLWILKIMLSSDASAKRCRRWIGKRANSTSGGKPLWPKPLRKVMAVDPQRGTAEAEGRDQWERAGALGTPRRHI